MTKDAKTRVLETAERLFYAEGLRAVGVDRIIAESGVAKATFYRHFPSKDDLVLAFLRARSTAWLDWLRTVVESHAAAPSDLPLVVFDALHARFKHRGYRGCAFINTIAEIAQGDHAAHTVSHEHKEELRRYVRDMLITGGYAAHAEELSSQFLILIDGAIVTSVREGKPDAALRARDVAATLLSGKQTH